MPLTRDSEAPRPDLRTLAAGLIISRVVLLGALYLALSGAEYSGDANILRDFAAEPLLILSGQTESHGQHPPLLPLLYGAPASIFQMLRLDSFIALRLPLILWETGAWLFLARAARPAESAQWPQSSSRLLMWIAILHPVGWMTSTVMAQDEVIGACLAAACLFCLAGRSWWFAAVVAGIGVVGGKIFLLILPVVLPILAPKSKRWVVALLAFSPIALAYVWVSLRAMAANNPMPLMGFSPGNFHGINAWALLTHLDAVPTALQRGPSMVLTLVSVVSIAYVIKTRIGTVELMVDARPVLALGLLSAGVLLVTFQLFYHVHSGYLMLLAPFLAASAFVSNRPILVMSVLYVISAWAVQFFHGLSKVAAAGSTLTGSDGKRRFLYLIEALPVQIPTPMLHIGAVAVCSIVGAIVTILVIQKATRCIEQDPEMHKKPLSHGW